MTRVATEDRRETPPPGPPRSTALPVRLAVVVAVAAAVVAYVLLVSPLGPWHAAFDLKVYRGAVVWWQDHQPLYTFHRGTTRYGFTYPPFAALVLSPWGWVSQSTAIVLDVVLNVALVVLLTWWMVGPIAQRRGWSRWYAVAVAVPLVYVMEPVRETIGFGQVNLILVALVLADVVGASRGRRWAGVGIGLATAVKLTPGLFVLYFLLTGRRRQALISVGTAVAATLVALAVAPHTSIQFWTHTLFQTDRIGKLYYFSNQSIMGVLARIAPDGRPSSVLWAVLALAVLVGGMWRARRAFRAGDELAGITVTGLLSCLLSPISWTHHLFWVVPAAVILLDAAGGAPVLLGERSRWRDRPRAVRTTAAAGAFVVIGVFVASIVWIGNPNSGGASTGHGFWMFVGTNVYAFVTLLLVPFLPARALLVPAREGAGTSSAASDVTGGVTSAAASGVSASAEPSGERRTTPPRPA